jgi:hypothetical protein
VHGRTSPERARWPGFAGVLLVLAGAGAGLAVTLLTGHQPGLVLAVFLVSGTMAAAFLVRRGSVHVIIPVPALAYLAAVIAAGFWHRQAAGATSTVLAVSTLQWLASGFTGICVATAIALVAAAFRRPRRARRARRGDRLRPDDDDGLGPAW